MLTNTTRAAETAVAENIEECVHDNNETECSAEYTSNKYNTDEAAIPLTRYKAKLEECAQLHQQLQSAHEELARLKHQINGQEISSTHAHNEIENLRVLQRMMHDELQTHQIRLRGLLKENDELAAQVHTLQEVCDYQFKCAERDKTNKSCSNVDNKVDHVECKAHEEILSLRKDRYRYSMKEMSDKLYFMTHAQNTRNDFISKSCVYNLRDTNMDCDSFVKTCKRKVNENVEEEKQTLLGAYFKASCDLNVEPHPQLLTSLYYICTCHSSTNTTESKQGNTELNNHYSKRNNGMNECNSLTMVEPPITFAQLAVVEQFLSKPFHEHHPLACILTGCVHRITLRMEEESNEAGINFFATHLLPHFTSLQHLEIYHVNTKLALRTLVESIAVLQVSQNTYKESCSSWESENTNITKTSKVNTLYLSLPFLSVHDDALQMLFKLLEQREELCKVNQTKELKNNNNTLQGQSNRFNDVEEHINSMQLPLLAMSTLDLSLCKLQNPCTLRSCHTCPHLTCLMLTNCTVLTNSLLHRLLRHVRELSHLDLSGCTLLDHDGVHFINSFANVKVLRMENVPQITKITLKHVEVLFSTLTCVRQLHMPLLKCLPLPIRNRALISTPDYFIAPHLQQVAFHDMVIDECTLNCFLQTHTHTRHHANSGASVDNAKESEQLSEEKKEEEEEEERSNSVKSKQQCELCILEFVNCTFTNDNALTKLLDVYKSQNTLHTLKLQGCVGLSELIVHSLPSSLRELNISFTPIACDKSLSVLVERCPNLESFNLCGSACTTTTTIMKDNQAEKGEHDKEKELGNEYRKCNNDTVTEYTLSEVGLRCLLSLTYIHTLNVLQLPSLTNDAIVLLIYSLPALKILYHETVAVSHLLNAKGELECELQTRANFGKQLSENIKDEQKLSSLTNFVQKSHNNMYCDNNTVVNLVNGKSRYCSLQVRRHDNDVDDDDVYTNNNNWYMKYKTNSFVPSLDILFEQVEKTRADEKEHVNNNTTICTLRDLLRYKRPAELMTWNEHQHPAFLINPAALAATSAENITRKFTLSNIHKENTKTINGNENTCDDDDDIIRNKVNNDKQDSSKKNSINKELQKMSTEEESEHRPISAISLTSNSTVSSSSSSSSSSLQEQEIKKSEEEENQVESDSNNAFASANKSGKRVSFIVPEESNNLPINSALHQNDKAMTHARNKARRSKLRQRQNSNTSENSTKLTTTESKDEAISNGKNKIQIASDNARVEIGPW